MAPPAETGADAASRSRRTHLQAQYFRLKARRGPKKAVITVAILTAVYHMLKNHAEPVLLKRQVLNIPEGRGSQRAAIRSPV
jgi:hypothetical protein